MTDTTCALAWLVETRWPHAQKGRRAAGITRGRVRQSGGGCARSGHSRISRASGRTDAGTPTEQRVALPVLASSSPSNYDRLSATITVATRLARQTDRIDGHSLSGKGDAGLTSRVAAPRDATPRDRGGRISSRAALEAGAWDTEPRAVDSAVGHRLARLGGPADVLVYPIGWARDTSATWQANSGESTAPRRTCSTAHRWLSWGWGRTMALAAARSLDILGRGTGCQQASRRPAHCSARQMLAGLREGHAQRLDGSPQDSDARASLRQGDRPMARIAPHMFAARRDPGLVSKLRRHRWHDSAGRSHVGNLAYAYLCSGALAVCVVAESRHTGDALGACALPCRQDGVADRAETAASAYLRVPKR